MNADTAHYYIVFTLIQLHHDSEIRWNTQSIVYVAVHEEDPTYKSIMDAVKEQRTSYYGRILITGYNKISKEAYDDGIREERERLPPPPPPGDCTIL